MRKVISSYMNEMRFSESKVGRCAYFLLSSHAPIFLFHPSCSSSFCSSASERFHPQQHWHSIQHFFGERFYICAHMGSWFFLYIPIMLRNGRTEGQILYEHVGTGGVMWVLFRGSYIHG